MAGLMGAAEAGLKSDTHDVDVCVIGGGMTGLCAALAAARHGARTILMHERPVLGGNASSEIRMHICGADRYGKLPNLRETGILEELRLENLYRNPQRSYSMWDAILYEKARYQSGLMLLLNCTCQQAQMANDRIVSVTGWQMTTNTYHTVRACQFIDCSGDGILAPLTGAEFRMGREGRAEFGESIGPEQPDAQTMGLTCLFETRRYDTPQPFSPPSWAYTFPTDGDLPYGSDGHQYWQYGYWWVELGGDHHSLHDAETMRDELLKIVFGVWDHIKNHGDHGAENWALEWIGFLPGKRESRRYVGDHVLTQGDIESGEQFPDTVAYGGWSMDDHHPAGFWAAKLGQPATIFHPAPSPYSIPLRALYSRNVSNLFVAGRCASCTHAAMSSTRVMATCSVMGQAVGTAAAWAALHATTPREVANQHIHELQQMLLRDDCYLPGVRQDLGPLTKAAWLTAVQGDPEPLRDGINRPVGDNEHCWQCRPGDWAAYTFAGPAAVKEAVLILDSALDRHITMNHDEPPKNDLPAVPDVMPKAFRLDTLQDGRWQELAIVSGNYQRLVRLPINQVIEGIRFTLVETWGAANSRVFAFYIN